MNKFIKFFITCFLVGGVLDSQAFRPLPPLATFVGGLFEGYRQTYPAHYSFGASSPELFSALQNSNLCSCSDVGLSFIDMLHEFIEAESKRISVPELWLGGLDKPFFELFDQATFSVEHANEKDLKFWVQKKIVPAGSITKFVGDLHGDMRSLFLDMLDWQNQGVLLADYIVAPGWCIVFTGDYIDRGPYSLDVLAMAFYLKLKNPDQVIILRGNHEEHTGMVVDADIPAIVANLAPEGAERQRELLIDLNKAFNLLPAALYLGVEHPDTHHIDYVMVAHGGFEISHCRPREFLEKDCLYGFVRYDRAQVIRNLKRDVEQFGLPAVDYSFLERSGFGMLWGDFFEDDLYSFDGFAGDGSRVQVGGKIVSSALKKTYIAPNTTMHMLIRGHQHSQGDIHVSPDHCIYTVISCDEMLCNLGSPVSPPSSGKQETSCTCYLQLTTDTHLDQWRLVVRRVHANYNTRKITVLEKPLALPPTINPIIPAPDTKKIIEFDIPVVQAAVGGSVSV